MTVISIIVAMDKNGVIGKDNKLPWHIPEDLAWFKKQTMGKTLVMGRKTHESIGKKLPGRTNLVITNNKGYESPHKDIEIYNSFEDVIKDYDELDELMIIGGADLFTSAFSFVSRMYITEIHAEFDGNTYFPRYNGDEWEIQETKSIESKGYLVDFNIYERIK